MGCKHPECNVDVKARSHLLMSIDASISHVRSVCMLSWDSIIVSGYSSRH